MTIEPSATLMAHCGARLVEREQIWHLPQPKSLGRLHQPIAHRTLLESFDGVFNDFGLKVRAEELAVQGNGSERIFGVFKLRGEPLGDNLPDRGFAMGFQGSHDQSLSLKIAAGTDVFVCDNLCFHSNMISMSKKQTVYVQLKHELSKAIATYITQSGALSAQINKAKRTELGPSQAVGLVLDAFYGDIGGKGPIMPTKHMPNVLNNFFRPAPEWTDITENERSLWSLHNSFTREAKGLRPNMKLKTTTKLGLLLATI